METKFTGAANPNRVPRVVFEKGERAAEHDDVPGYAKTFQKTWTCPSALPRSQHREHDDSTNMVTMLLNY